MLFATQGAEVSTRSHRRDPARFRLYCCQIRLKVIPKSLLGCLCVFATLLVLNRLCFPQVLDDGVDNLDYMSVGSVSAVQACEYKWAIAFV